MIYQYFLYLAVFWIYNKMFLYNKIVFAYYFKLIVLFKYQTRRLIKWGSFVNVINEICITKGKKR